MFGFVLDRLCCMQALWQPFFFFFCRFYACLKMIRWGSDCTYSRHAASSVKHWMAFIKIVQTCLSLSEWSHPYVKRGGRLGGFLWVGVRRTQVMGGRTLRVCPALIIFHYHCEHKDVFVLVVWYFSIPYVTLCKSLNVQSYILLLLNWIAFLLRSL